MAFTKEKRKKIELIVLGVMDKLDKSKINSKKYKDFFANMSDMEFDKWIKRFLEDEDENFRLEVLPFKNEPSYQDIEAAAKLINVPLEEYVYLPMEKTSEGEPIRTKFKVPVGYLHIKRLQQIVSKKTNYSTSISKRNSMTNQVTGESKVARNSDMETQALYAMESNLIAKELLGARADNQSKKLAMYNMISRDGFVSQTAIDEAGSIFERSSLNMIDMYLLGCGLKSDLVTNDNVLPITVLKKDF